MASQLPFEDDPVEICEIKSFPPTFGRSPSNRIRFTTNRTPFRAEPNNDPTNFANKSAPKPSRCQCGANSYDEEFAMHGNPTFE